MEKKKNNRQNTVSITGYLKENNLEKIVNSRQEDVIRGSLLVAVSELNCHKVQFYVSSKTKEGEKSQDYEKLLSLLPSETVSVASFLKDNPGSNFEQAAQAATKVWVVAKLEEFVSTNSDNRTMSMVTLKGFKAGIKTATDSSPFVPHADFTVDAYIENMYPEMEGDTPETTQETGRQILFCLIPNYDKSVNKISFIAPVENKDGVKVAEYVAKNYHVGDTVTLKGSVVNIVERIVKEPVNEEEYFGVAPTPQYETRFIHERLIAGGSSKAIPETDTRYISAKEAKDGLAEREIKAKKNGETRANKAAAQQSAAAADDFGAPANASKGTVAPTETPEFAKDLDF